MSIDLILGPMFSGKTTELLRLLNRHKYANKKILIVKYENDTRYDINLVSTHDLVKNDISFDIIKTMDLEIIDKYLNDNDIDVIGIDEGQFFNNIAYYCDKWANNDKRIIVSALDGDFKRDAFENIIKLFPKCENIRKLSAICKCSKKAQFTYRKVNDKDLVLIGGVETYTPLCRKCYFLM